MNDPTAPRHLYVHVPFCAHKCDYCAFYSYAGATGGERDAYLTRLHAEIADLPEAAPLASIYIGGGTPSTLTPEEMTRLFDAIEQIPRATDCEISIECNPGTVNRDRIQLLLSRGVNRFSLGVQSFSERLRQAIGRGGDIRTIARAVGILQDCGVSNYNCDLIYGIPEQTFAELEEDLRRIISFQPAHVSTYSLIIEPGTKLALRGGREGDDEAVVNMWTYIGETLASELGLLRYEIANHARPGAACRHNVDIWYGARFLGAGPSACWFVGDTRLRNAPDLRRWLQQEAPEADILPSAARAAEILTTGLRTVEGWTAALFQSRSGHHWRALCNDAVAALKEEGLLIGDEQTLRPTTRGLLFHDHITRELLV